MTVSKQTLQFFDNQNRKTYTMTKTVQKNETNVNDYTFGLDVNEVKKMTSVSSQVRYLTSKGLTRPQIGKFFEHNLGRTIRPQHVRNVQVTPLKKG